MATQSDILAWKIPWTEEPGILQSRGSQRIGHDRAAKHTVESMAEVPFSPCRSFSLCPCFPRKGNHGLYHLFQGILTQRRSWQQAQAGQCC